MAQLIEDIVLDASAGVHRPRNLDWKRAAALLYGDWGTSKAYVIGLAFVAAGFHHCPLSSLFARSPVWSASITQSFAGIFLMGAVFILQRVRKEDCSRWSAHCCCSRTSRLLQR